MGGEQPVALHSSKVVETKQSTYMSTCRRRDRRWEGMVLKMARPRLLNTSLCF